MCPDTRVENARKWQDTRSRGPGTTKKFLFRVLYFDNEMVQDLSDNKNKENTDFPVWAIVLCSIGGAAVLAAGVCVGLAAKYGLPKWMPCKKRAAVENSAAAQA